MDTNIMKSKILTTVKQLIKYNDVGFVFANLENLVIIPIPYKNVSDTLESYNLNKKYALLSNSTAQKTLKKLIDELTLRKETFKAIQETNPNFCMITESKMSPIEYKKYKCLMQKCIKAIATLIFLNTHNESFRHGNMELNKQDLTSEIIDSSDSIELSHMEDEFVLNELDSLDYSKLNPNIKRNIEVIRKEINQRLKNYDFYKKLVIEKKKVIFKVSEPNR